MHPNEILLTGLLLGTACLCSGAQPSAEPESHAPRLLRQILDLKTRVLAETGTNPPPVFATFWDFDGTILAGDCSEGWQRDGQWIYPGLARRCIEAGFSPLYPRENGWENFWRDYRYMDENVGHWLAYPFIAQMLRGARLKDVEDLVTAAFRKDFQRYYFRSSMEIIRGLQREGIEVHVVSASPEVFVRGAAPTVGIPPDRIYGIRVQVNDGHLTERLVYPVTWAEGKTERINEVIAARRAADPNRPLHILAGFGNSYSTDGPFLKWIAEQRLPGNARPVAIMINGGKEPDDFAGSFELVGQTDMVERPRTR